MSHITWQNELQHSTGEIWEPEDDEPVDGKPIYEVKYDLNPDESIDWDSRRVTLDASEPVDEQDRRRAPLRGNWLEHQTHATPSPNCHLCKEWAGWRAK